MSAKAMVFVIAVFCGTIGGLGIALGSALRLQSSAAEGRVPVSRSPAARSGEPYSSRRSDEVLEDAISQ